MFNSKFDRHIKRFNILILLIVVFITILPLGYILIASFMDPITLASKGISFNPSNWSIEAYRKIFKDDAIVRGFINSFFYATSFAVLTVAVTMMTAYPLTKKDLVGRRFITIFFLITMFVGGGLVPTYLLVKNLNMLDTIWAIIIPGVVNVWNIILARTYFNGIPEELSEAAKIDGANDVQIFFKIMLPLAKPIMFVLFLYAFVGQWNSYFDAMIYLKDPKLEPLQLVLRKILIQNQPSTDMIGSQVQLAELKRMAELLKYATIVVSSLPLLVMYPFFQKYFEEGVLLGSIKG